MKKDMILKKIDWLILNNYNAHVERYDEWFFNGPIEEVREADELFVIRDRKSGLNPIYFEEVKRIDKFIEVKKEGAHNGETQGTMY